MKRIIDYSIRSKLTIIVMATTCAALSLAVVSLGIFEALRVRAQLRTDAITTARIVANNSTAVLSFEDISAAKEVLEALQGDGHIGSAAIYDAAGQRLASYQREDWPTLPSPASIIEYAKYTDRGIEVAQTVMFGGKRIGMVALQMDDDEFRERLKRSIWTGVGVLMLLLPDHDAGRAWQTRADRTREELFQLGANVFLYAIDRQNLRVKGETYVVRDKGGPTDKSLKVARLTIGDNPTIFSDRAD